MRPMLHKKKGSRYFRSINDFPISCLRPFLPRSTRRGRREFRCRAARGSRPRARRLEPSFLERLVAIALSIASAARQVSTSGITTATLDAFNAIAIVKGNGRVLKGDKVETVVIECAR